MQIKKNSKVKGNNQGKYRCSECNLKLCNRRLLYLHRNLFHGVLDTDNNHIIDPDLNFQGVIDANKQHIYGQPKIGSLKSTYNYFTRDMAEGYSEIIQQLDDIYKDQKNAFKIAIQPGFMLQSVAEPEKFRYFIPGDNENIMDSPFQVTKYSHLRQLINKFKKIDIRKYLKTQRPNSKYQVYYVTNFNYVVFPTDYNLGFGVNFPNFFFNKKSIHHLYKDKKGKPYKDKACLFRALCFYYMKKVDNPIVKQIP